MLPRNKSYPLSLSIGLIIGAVVLSFVDLTFLNDIIGKILDIGLYESAAIAFALGMVGIAIMAHHGANLAHPSEQARWWHALGSYTLWIVLGVSFVAIRLFSASILQLDAEVGDKALLNIFGFDVREVDVIIAPLMLVLYLATGVMVKSGVTQLYQNPDFETWQANRKEARDKKKADLLAGKTKAMRRIEEAQAKAEKLQLERMKEIADTKAKQLASSESAAIKSALNGSYGHARAQYEKKLAEMKGKFETISTNISSIESIDRQEEQFEQKIKPSLLKIIEGSITSAQNSVALAIRAKTGEDLVGLCTEIDLHNAKRK